MPNDEFLAPTGRVMENAQQAPLRGLARGLLAHRAAWAVQLLRGVHPHRRFDVQPARQVAEGHVAPAVAAEDCLLTYLLASHVWRQDHNGFTHQDSGFIDHVVQAEVVVFTFPPTPTAYCR